MRILGYMDNQKRNLMDIEKDSSIAVESQIK